MPPETMRLQARLAQHLDALCQLEVVEAAEEVVRDHRLSLLDGELARLYEELAEAGRYLDAARDGHELGVIFEAEELMCGILHKVTTAQRRAGEHIRSSNRAHDAYLTQRQWLTASIDRLRHLLM